MTIKLPDEGDPDSPREQTVQPPIKLNSNTDWLSNSLLAAKAISAGADCLPFPYVDGLFRMIVIFMETVEVIMPNFCSSRLNTLILRYRN
jgi:hypothetical protein